MDNWEKRALASKGWTVGSTTDFLGMSPEEARFIELKLALAASLRAERLRQDVTQVEFAKLLGTSHAVCPYSVWRHWRAPRVHCTPGLSGRAVGRRWTKKGRGFVSR